MFLVLLFQIMAPSNSPRPATPFKTALLVILILAGIFGAFAVAIWGIARARNHFFPVAVFAIGQGLARHTHHEQIRWVVMIGFGVGLAASILATVLLAV